MIFGKTLQRVRSRLSHYSVFERMFEVFERTPIHAMHWYALVMFGFAATCINVAIAWAVFASVGNNTNENVPSVGDSATIQRDELRKAIDAYRVRALEFEQIQQDPPRIIDPGR